jgi:hypothetical protein
MSDITLKTSVLDGKTIAYASDTEFLVQCSKRRTSKSEYETRARFVGNLAQAVMYYNMINVGNGYRKRLLMPSAAKPVLARQGS